MRGITVISLCIWAAFAANLKSSSSSSSSFSGPADELILVYVRNVHFNKVIEDQSPNPPAPKPWRQESKIFANIKNPEPIWNQVMYLTNIGFDEDAYVLAFDKQEDSKVLTCDGSYPISKLYEEASEISKTEWKLVPVGDDKKAGFYQIISMHNNRALAMKDKPVTTEDKNQVYLVQPDIRDERQRWQFRDVETDEIVMYGSSKQPSSILHLSSSSSEEETRKVNSLRENSRNQWESKFSGNMKTFPIPNSKCSQEDFRQKIASPNSCQTFLSCDPNDCTWKEYPCSGSRYWNILQKTCVQSQFEATCGAVTFGSEAKVHVENVYYGKVLDYCMDCQNNYTFIGFDKNADYSWNQVLVAKRREDDQFYSLAFDKTEQGQVKVISNTGRDKPIVKTFLPQLIGTQWIFTPVNRNKNAYQIISFPSYKALELNKVNDQHHQYQVRLVKPNQYSEKQHWQFEDIQTGQLLSANSRQPQFQRNGNALPE